MFWLWLTSAILGVSMHWLQSSVGKTLGYWIMCPPMLGRFSTRCTFIPYSLSLRLVVIPATPPPIINASGTTSIVFDSRGTDSFTLMTAPLTRSSAFWVAPSWSSLCTQLHCSLMFTISRKAELTPFSSRLLRNVVLCILGVQQASTTLSSPCFSTASFMASTLGLLQRYRSTFT